MASPPVQKQKLDSLPITRPTDEVEANPDMPDDIGTEPDDARARALEETKLVEVESPSKDV